MIITTMSGLALDLLIDNSSRVRLFARYAPYRFRAGNFARATILDFSCSIIKVGIEGETGLPVPLTNSLAKLR